MIHLIATMTEPCLHFEFNEAWILHGENPPADDNALRANPATSIRDVREYTEHDAAGRLTQRYNGGIGSDGRFLLHGAQTWYQADGKVQREATYALGRITGVEKFYRDGVLQWQRDHQADGTTIWTNYWPDGRTRTQSTWRDLHAEGPAVLNDSTGKEIYRVEFEHGVPVRESGNPGEN
jgi:hypothetical protein